MNELREHDAKLADLIRAEVRQPRRDGARLTAESLRGAVRGWLVPDRVPRSSIRDTEEPAYGTETIHRSQALLDPPLPDQGSVK